MMDVDLNIWTLLRSAEDAFGNVEVVTQVDPTTRHRYRLADFALRARRLASALDDLGLAEDARVATMAWNSYQHLECYFGIPASGRVLHTLNARLAFDDLEFIVNDAGDEALLVPRDLLPIAEKLQASCSSLRHVIVLDASPEELGGGMRSYEELLAEAHPLEGERPIPERAPLGICYTSGTTGRPKGVLATHRSTVLHAMATMSGNGPALSASECVLPVVPMFHVYAWGLPFAAVGAGTKIVFPTPSFVPSILVDLINEEGVTKAAGVPTIWIAVLEELERSGKGVGRLRELLCGGSQPPAAMIQAYLERYGVALLQAWGMTESSPIATTTRLPHALTDATIPTKVAFLASAGHPIAGISLQLLDDDLNPVPADGRTMGNIYLRGPWVLDSYLHNQGADAFEVEGWFRTGDVGTRHPDGVLQLVDRTKDLIKSGGEWISSVMLEGALMGHPKVLEAAVVAVPDPKWLERPLAAVVVRGGQTLTLEELQQFLLERGFPKWQLPDRLELVDEIPRTSVGKFDKKVLRARFGAAQTGG